MKSVAVSAAEHETAGKFVNYDDLAVFDDVVHIALHYISCLEGLDHMVVDLHVFRISQVFNAKKLFALGHAFVSQSDFLILFLDGEVFFGRQSPDTGICPLVQVCGLISSSGNYQRSPGLVYQDRVYLVDDGKVQISLDKLLFVDGHVIPEVVKTEFIVGPICDIRIISRLFCIIAHTLDNAAHGQAQESIYLSHPLGVSPGQIVVDGHHMDTLSFKGVEIGGKGRYQSLSFTGLHLGDPALVEHDTAYDLYAEMSHTYASPGSFTAYSKSFRQYIVESFTCRQSFLEFGCLSSQFII